MPARGMSIIWLCRVIIPIAPMKPRIPPLGKVLIAFSISIFGMTPFGWRFAGALAGVLMLPGMYLLGKLLTKRRMARLPPCS